MGWLGACLASYLFAGQPMQAGTFTWDGDTSNLWSNVLNWDALPASATDTSLVFNVAGSASPNQTSNNLGNPFQLNSMTFGVNMTVSGSKLDFAGTTPLVTVVPGISVVFNNDLNITTANTTFRAATNVTNTSTIEFKGLLSGSTLRYANTGSSPQLTFKFSGSQANTMSGFTMGDGTSGRGAGKVQIAMDDPFGGAGTTFSLANSAVTVEALGGDRSVASGTSRRGDLTLTGSYSLTFKGNGSVDTGGGRSITNNITAGKKLTFEGNMDLSRTSLIGSGYGEILGVVSDGTNGHLVGNTTIAGVPLKSGSGTWALKGPNTYTGQTKVFDGTLEFNSVENKGSTAASALGKPTVDGTKEVISLGNLTTVGTLRYIGTIVGGHSTDRPLNLAGTSGGGTLDASGAGPISFLGGVAASGLGNKTLTLAGNNTGDNTLGGVIVDSTGFATALRKDDDGTWILTGANTYSGGTTLARGTLLVNNTTDSGTGSGSVTVDPGATLGGTGSIAGAVNVSGVLSPGASVASLSSGTLTFNHNSTFAYEVDSLGLGADLQLVDGNLTLTGVVNLTLEDIAVTDQAFAANTKFSLINYKGDWNGGFFTYDGNELGNNEEFTAGLNKWKIVYNADDGGTNFSSEFFGGTDKFVNLAIVIPEPRAALLGLLGVLVLLLHRRF